MNRIVFSILSVFSISLSFAQSDNDTLVCFEKYTRPTYEEVYDLLVEKEKEDPQEYYNSDKHKQEFAQFVSETNSQIDTDKLEKKLTRSGFTVIWVDNIDSCPNTSKYKLEFGFDYVNTEKNFAALSLTLTVYNQKGDKQLIGNLNKIHKELTKN